MQLVMSLQCPFVDRIKATCDFAIVPSRGSWYSMGREKATGLHIGMIDESGRVMSFDRNGISLDEGPNWSQCLPLDFMKYVNDSVGLCKDLSDMFQGLWGQAFKDIESKNELLEMTESKFDDDTNNCFDFALVFLQLVRDRIADQVRMTDNRHLRPLIDLMGELMSDKEQFVMRIVLPKTKVAACYLALDRKMKANEFTDDQSVLNNYETSWPSRASAHKRAEITGDSNRV